MRKMAPSVGLFIKGHEECSDMMKLLYIMIGVLVMQTLCLSKLSDSTLKIFAFIVHIFTSIRFFKNKIKKNLNKKVKTST